MVAPTHATGGCVARFARGIWYRQSASRYTLGADGRGRRATSGGRERDASTSDPRRTVSRAASLVVRTAQLADVLARSPRGTNGHAAKENAPRSGGDVFAQDLVRNVLDPKPAWVYLVFPVPVETECASERRAEERETRRGREVERGPEHAPDLLVKGESLLVGCACSRRKGQLYDPQVEERAQAMSPARRRRTLEHSQHRLVHL